VALDGSCTPCLRRRQKSLKSLHPPKSATAPRNWPLPLDNAAWRRDLSADMDFLVLLFNYRLQDKKLRKAQTVHLEASVVC